MRDEKLVVLLLNFIHKNRDIIGAFFVHYSGCISV